MVGSAPACESLNQASHKQLFAITRDLERKSVDAQWGQMAYRGRRQSWHDPRKTTRRRQVRSLPLPAASSAMVTTEYPFQRLKMIRRPIQVHSEGAVAP